MSNLKTAFATRLTPSQLTKLERLLSESPSWEPATPPPYALWKSKRDNVSVTAYESMKISVQGKGTGDFVCFVLEPEITGVLIDNVADSDSSVGLDAPELAEPHAGIDESGKGDFFGPLVVAAVFVDDKNRGELIDVGVKDSKLIKSDARISAVANKIRKIVDGAFDVIAIRPERYNALYSEIGNLNKLLAWGHARVLENLLEKIPGCRVALADKFAAESVTTNALMKRGRSVKFLQITKGERDLAVAAASILARDEFVRRLRSLSDKFGLDLPKGASAAVEEAGTRLVNDHGADVLHKVAKTHFKTASKILDFQRSSACRRD